MESMVMKLFRQLIELGVFGKSWVPILSKKYLIGVQRFELTVSRNDGPGVIGVHKSFDCTHLVTLNTDGSTVWGNVETFGEHELEQVLQALIDVYPPELNELGQLGFSSMQWPNLPKLLEKLDTLSAREAFTALAEKGLFLVNQFPMITDDKQFAVFFNKTPQMISICKNDGDISQHDVPGLLGEIGKFTRVCHLRSGNIVWSHEGYGTKHVEDVLNELHTKFVASQQVDPLKFGMGVEDHENDKGYVHYEKGTAIFGLMHNLKANGVFGKTRDPVFINDLGSLTNAVAFFCAEIDYVLFCNSWPHHEYADGRVEIVQKEGPSLFYDKLLQARLAQGPIVVARYFNEDKYGEDTLQRVLQVLVNSSAGIMNPVYPLGRGLTQKSIEQLFKEQSSASKLDNLGRGLTLEAAQKLFREQNPHMFNQEGAVKEIPFISPDELARDIMAGANMGLNGIGYLFMMDAEGNPVHSDGSPLSVNDGKGNLLMGADAMAFMQKRIQKGLSPKPDNDTVNEGQRAEYIAKLRKDLPDLVNEDGSWDLMAIASKAHMKTRENREGYINVLESALRESFKDDTKYIAFLKRMIKLQVMSPEEFMEDSKRSAEELTQMYPTTTQVFEPGATIFSSITPGVKPPLYVPHPDEPSPFGPDQENYVDNPWVVWKNDQEGYDAQHQGSSVLLRKALIEQLKAERYRSQVDRESVSFEMLTGSGKLSLGYVIHIRYSRRMEWEEAHRFGLQKIEQFNQSR